MWLPVFCALYLTHRLLSVAVITESRSDWRMERLDAAGDSHLPPDGSQQDPANLHADQSHGLVVSVPVWLRAFLLLFQQGRLHAAPATDGVFLCSVAGVPAPALNSLLASKWPGISNHSKSPWIGLLMRTRSWKVWNMAIARKVDQNCQQPRLVSYCHAHTTAFTVWYIDRLLIQGLELALRALSSSLLYQMSVWLYQI